MSVELLKREPLPTATEALLEADFTELAERAASELGYAMPKRSVEDGGKACNVAAKFAELGIQPFSRESVEGYKKWRIGRWFGWAGNVSDAMSFACFLASFILSIVFIASFTEGFAVEWQVVIGIALGMCGTGFYIFLSDENKAKLRWASSPIRDYSRPIPEFAIQTALDVKAAFPGAFIKIEELVRDSTTDDPFLVAEIAGVDHYLEVWNEPGFGGKREV